MNLLFINSVPMMKMHIKHKIGSEHTMTIKINIAMKSHCGNILSWYSGAAAFFSCK